MEAEFQALGNNLIICFKIDISGTTRFNFSVNSRFRKTFSLLILPFLVESFVAQTSFGKPRAKLRPVLDGFNADEIAVVKDLQKREQIKIAPCYAIADMVLSEAGLPKIGSGTAIKGERMDLDRRGEAQTPPRFVDGVIHSRSPYESIRVEAKSKAGGWILKTIREKKEHGKDTVFEISFSFTIGSRMNQTSCDLDKIDVKSGSYADKFDAHSCMALLQLDQSALTEWIPHQEIHSWLKSDCQLGMHYFGSLKDLIEDDTKKHVR